MKNRNQHMIPRDATSFFILIKNLISQIAEFNSLPDKYFAYFEIKCPNIKASEMEMNMNGTDFHSFADLNNITLQFCHKLIDNQN